MRNPALLIPPTNLAGRIADLAQQLLAGLRRRLPQRPQGAQPPRDIRQTHQVQARAAADWFESADRDLGAIQHHVDTLLRTHSGKTITVDRSLLLALTYMVCGAQPCLRAGHAVLVEPEDFAFDSAIP